MVIVGDLRDAVVPGQVAAEALRLLGPVDILVNNAAFAARLPTVATDAALIDEMLAVNVRAPLLLIAALVPAMVEQG
ncbi:MAG: short-chain dehydrogenase/reductase, partial [Acidimicrobiia bacterium]|nr:short-chain dehydrogenase/reductase [Acidimicrobiia bacterium]